MKTIHKFRLDSDKQLNILTLREGYRVVRCEYIVPSKAVFLWVEQPLNVDVPTVERKFQVAFSGDALPAHFRYVDTALDPFGPEAYHVFEVMEDQQRRTEPADVHPDLFRVSPVAHQGAA